jgi:FAD/FMN-containing dehydrogenase
VRAVTAHRDRLRKALVAAVGPTQVLTEPDTVGGYVRDWTGRWNGDTSAVVRPGSVEEVRAILEACERFSTPVVPQGGNTGLVGGSVPHRGEVVLSLRRLDRIGPVEAGQVTVGAGATVGALQEAAGRAGMRYGVDLASRDSATVGGTIATNAGGRHVLAYGDTRRQVLGLEVVFADGSVATRLSGPGKESLGPDPIQLMIGSEGTLGVVTAARLRLVTAPPGLPTVTLVGLSSLAEGLRQLGPGVTSLEFFDHACLEQVTRHRQLPPPLAAKAPFYLLVESEQLPDLSPGTEAVVDRRLWAYREAITETLNSLGVPHKLDVAVPPHLVDDFVAGLDRLDLEGQRYLFGHLAEGNFHLNLIGVRHPEAVEERVFGLVAGLGGAIASEHGVGVAKSGWWRRTTDPTLLSVSRLIKQALDPKLLLNPEVLWGE